MKMWICDVCGREMRSKIRINGYTLCSKHYNQLKKYGKFLDNNPRTPLDKNEYHICGDVTYIDLYNKECEKIAQAKIDTEDLDKVKYIKWKLSGSGYVMNTPKFKGASKHMSRVILDTDEFVDHRNHNTLDNRKCNLRIATKSQNQMNANYSGVSFIGNKYVARIKKDQKAVILGHYIDKDEAYFARWYAEKILFKEYAYPKEKPFVLPRREKEIITYVENRINKYFKEEGAETVITDVVQPDQMENT